MSDQNVFRGKRGTGGTPILVRFLNFDSRVTYRMVQGRYGSGRVGVGWGVWMDELVNWD